MLTLCTSLRSLHLRKPERDRKTVAEFECCLQLEMFKKCTNDRNGTGNRQWTVFFVVDAQQRLWLYGCTNCKDVADKLRVIVKNYMR